MLYACTLWFWFYMVLKENKYFLVLSFCGGHEIQLGVDVWEYREMKVNGTGKFWVSKLTLRASWF